MNAARQAVAQLHRKIEHQLAKRVPGALTPRLRGESERLLCGVESVDVVLQGGVCVGAITELVGPECSGRTTMALAYVAAAIQRGNVAAWIDVEDRLDPMSAAETGVDLTRLLWARCGGSDAAQAPAMHLALEQQATAMAAPAGKPIPGGGGSPHPRSEGKSMPQAIETLLLAQPRSAAIQGGRRNRVIGTPGAPNRSVKGLDFAAVNREEQIPTDRRPSRRAAAEMARNIALEPRCAESQRHPAWEVKAQQPVMLPVANPPAFGRLRRSKADWNPLDQALRAADLLLQAGGFAVIVLDLGSTPAEMSWRVPLATWFRFRAACERTRTVLVVLTQHPCARSSAGLLAQLEPGTFAVDNQVVVGLEHVAEVQRTRFAQPVSNIVPIRKGPQPVRTEANGRWEGAAAWAIRQL